MNNNKQIEGIYNEFKDPLYNYLYRMCGDHALAQDIVQHTFVKVLTDPKIAEAQHLKAYLFTIARNKLYDEWKRKPTESLDFEAMPYSRDDDADSQPQDQLEQAEINDEILKVLKRLPVNFREIMLLRYSEDLAVADVAKVTGRSLSDVKVSLHRARHKFESQFTSSMYSKIALSRSQCEKLRGMLAPYRERELSSTQVEMIYKHISQCAVCNEDAEEMKRKRQLFAALPMLPFPIAFDEFAKQLPPMAFNSSNDASDTPSAADAGTSQAAAQTVSGKLIAGVAAGVIAGGAGLYFAANDDAAVSTAPVAQTQPSTAPVAPPPKPSKDQGQLTVQARFGSQATAPAFAKDIEWTLRESNPTNADKPDVQQAKGLNAAFTLNKGRYLLSASLGDFEERATVDISAGDQQDKTIELNIGQLQVSPATLTDKTIDPNAITWSLHRKDADNTRIAHFTGSKELLLNSGDYELVARHPHNLVERRDIRIGAGESNRIEQVALEHGQLQLAALSKGLADTDLQRVTWLVDRLNNGKTVESRLTEATGDKASFMLAPGDYRVRALLGLNAESSLNVNIAKGKTTSRQDVEIKAGAITLDTQWPTALSAHQSGVQWEIHTSATELNDKTRIGQASEARASFALAPGKYRVRALAGLNFVTERSIDVGAGGKQQTIPVKIEPAVIQLSAFGTHSSKPLVKDIHWTLEPAGANPLTGAKPLSEIDSANASFVLQAGRYRVTARHKDKFVQSMEYDLKPGVSLTEVVNIDDNPSPAGFIWR